MPSEWVQGEWDGRGEVSEWVQGGWGGGGELSAWVWGDGVEEVCQVSGYGGTGWKRCAE